MPKQYIKFGSDCSFNTPVVSGTASKFPLAVKSPVHCPLPITHFSECYQYAMAPFVNKEPGKEEPKVRIPLITELYLV
jgi:hypothetical protein